MTERMFGPRSQNEDPTDRGSMECNEGREYGISCGSSAKPDVRLFKQTNVDDGESVAERTE